MTEIHFDERDSSHFLHCQYPCVINRGGQTWPDATEYIEFRRKEAIESKGKFMNNEELQDLDFKIMKHALKVKFKQHPDLREMLLATGQAKIVFDTVADSFWGVATLGKSKRQRNQMGELLMEVRTTMKRYEEKLQCKRAKWERPATIRFKQHDKDSFLSNHYPSIIKEEWAPWPIGDGDFGDKTWPTAADYFTDKSNRELDRKGWMRYELDERESEEHDYRVMKHVLTQKFRQHPELAQKLLDTGGAKLVMETSSDSFWGDPEYCGCRVAQNHMGKLLMQLRHTLQQEQPATDTKRKREEACCIVCATAFPNKELDVQGWTLLCASCADYNELGLGRLCPVPKRIPDKKEDSHDGGGTSDEDMGF